MRRAIHSSLPAEPRHPFLKDYGASKPRRNSFSFSNFNLCGERALYAGSAQRRMACARKENADCVRRKRAKRVRNSRDQVQRAVGGLESGTARALVGAVQAPTDAGAHPGQIQARQPPQESASISGGRGALRSGRGAGEPPSPSRRLGRDPAVQSGRGAAGLGGRGGSGGSGGSSPPSGASSRSPEGGTEGPPEAPGGRTAPGRSIGVTRGPSASSNGVRTRRNSPKGPCVMPMGSGRIWGQIRGADPAPTGERDTRPAASGRGETCLRKAALALPPRLRYAGPAAPAAPQRPG